jgi:hypothetical protein
VAKKGSKRQRLIFDLSPSLGGSKKDITLPTQSIRRILTLLGMLILLKNKVSIAPFYIANSILCSSSAAF